MTLSLLITNVEKLDNNVSTRLRLDRHGAVIGRSPQADWSLPDPQHYISSTHCEIDFRDGVYVLTDKSTNGTLLNGAQTRMTEPRILRQGDRLQIGGYLIAVSLEGAAATAAAEAAAGPAPQAPSWGGWEASGGAALPAPPVAASSWDAPAPQAAITGAGPMSANWGAPRVEPPPSAASVWSTPAEPVTPASGWSSPVTAPPPEPSAVDVWGKLSETNKIDWNRGGFGAAPLALAPEPARDPFGLGDGPPAAAWAAPASPASAGAASWAQAPTPAAAPAAIDWGPRPTSTLPASPAADAWGPPPSPAAPPPAPAAAAWGGAATVAPGVGGWGGTPASAAAPAPSAAFAPSAPVAPAGGEWAAFLAGAGLTPTDVKSDPRAALAAAGDLLRRLVAGMVVMLEARARAKAQLGAQSTALELDGNNPLKFARSPDRALAQMLSPKERGFMAPERAIEDAFRDLQAHQVATLSAMQGALGATLARFSPQSIRERAETRGLLSRILPSARDAELWGAYEREFEGVARGSDEAFMDVFAKEFRVAYEKAASDLKSR